jgi:hypothetical protein
MRIGEKVTTYTDNMFSQYILGINENGTSVEIPVHVVGTVADIKQTNKTGKLFGVDFKFRDVLGDEKEVRIYLQQKTLKVTTQ